ncbi:MAG TPA: hypothetical protein VHZ96_16200 [Frankiaceae bacterium]|jgi:hypothetical protein|nr:hypothetical protein [Frankiaceae bacterium]
MTSAVPAQTPIVVGLLADEGFPALVAHYAAAHLPKDLATELDDVDWDIRVSSQPLGVNEHGRIPILKLAAEYRSGQGWDLLVLITDLPHRVDRQPIVCEFNTDCGVALASVPALGAIRIRRRTRALLVHLIRHLTVTHLGLASAEDGSQQRQRLHARVAQRIAPVSQMESKSADTDLQFALIGLRGRIRLLAGMVRDNRPWLLVPHLSTATAAALATAAYGLVSTDVWRLANALAVWRLAFVNVAAIAAMTTWLLGYHHLWERPADRTERETVLLNNVSTVITLAVGVACMYALLFALTFLAASAVIDSSLLHSEVVGGRGIAEYIVIVWFACSVGIVAGAIGSSLETEQAIEKATYSRRERARRGFTDRATQEQDPR